MNYTLLLLAAFVFGIFAIIVARTFFRDERGMGASQWFFAALFWLVLMTIAWVWLRYRLPLPFALGSGPRLPGWLTGWLASIR